MNLMRPNNYRQWLPLACLVACAAAPNNAMPQTTPAAWEPPGAYHVETAEYPWHDAKRDRDVPAKIYFPKDAPGKSPVIIFSHGLGGSRQGYEYLGRYWASHGYVSVHLDHIGSDAGVWQNLRFDEIKPALARAVLKPENSINRPLDVSFAIDQLEKAQQDDPTLKGRLDLQRIGVAGHSFGAYTTMAVAGEVFIPLAGHKTAFTDPRVKAAIAMSTPVTEATKAHPAAFSKIMIPVFHMTGTLDDSPIGETKAADRRLPYDQTHAPNQYLVTFNGGDHMIFSGRPSGRNSPNAAQDAEFQRLISVGSTAFWDAYLKDDAGAKAWLRDGGYAKVLAADGKLEEK
jgi:predicted dienelactone hydrolase